MIGVEPTRGTTAGAGRDADLLRAMVHRIDQRDPGAFNNLGVLYYSKGLYAEAVDAFLRALELDARMRTAARNLEVAAAKPGACDARLTALSERLDRHPDDVSARRERARLLRLIGRHAEATSQLDELIEEDPDDGLSMFERGLVEQRAGDLRRAQRWYERAVNAPTSDPLARLHLAEVLYQRGQNEQALVTLDAALRIDPSIADAHLLRGFVLGDIGRHEAAMAASQEAARLNPSLQALQPHLSLEHTGPALAVISDERQPESGLAHYGLGLAFRQRGYFEEARREFKRALAKGESARLVCHAIAELDLIAGESGSACSAYDQLLRNEPDHARYWNERGVALHQRGDLRGAAESYQSALRFDPRYALAYNNLGVALFDLDDKVAAREALIRANEIDPSFIRARLNLAHSLLDAGDARAALALMRELVEFHPRDADAWHALGGICLKLTWLDAARTAFSRAVEERPGHADARYGLARVLGALGDSEGALRETEAALGLAPVHSEARMSVAIDLQRECPEACGALSLLSVGRGAPLTGVAFAESDLASLLPEPGVAAHAIVSPSAREPVADARRACEEAEGHATRGLVGEALDRYVQARALLEPQHATPGTMEYSLWRRAAVGEARARCLLGQGANALPLLKTLGAHNARDVEVLALFACSAAAAGASHNDAARKAVLRILRLEPNSAALMHFVGDVATTIGDEGLALACYRRALTVDPTRPSPRVSIARLLRVRGDLLAARLELVAALTAAPALRDAIIELVHVHRDADRPLDALALLTRHLATTPTDLEGLIMLAETLVRLDRDEDARVAVTRVLRHDASHMHALWLEGLLLSRQSRMRDALERWRKVAADRADAPLAKKAQRAIDDAEAPRLSRVS